MFFFYGLREKTIEIWADSFHEGEWCCDKICEYAESAGYHTSKEFQYGFMPIYVIQYPDITIKLEVYGSYSAWKNIPSKISSLLKMGKPDFIAYSTEDDAILFAVEETSATMTGNQPTQRCERQYGSAKNNIPFWYLVSEYGTHLDGGRRRDSIWPTIAALKLTMHYNIPNLVLHYSAEDAPGDYSEGKGLDFLFSFLVVYLQGIFISSNKNILIECLEQQYKEMLKFVESQWSNQIDFLPSLDKLKDSVTANTLAYNALLGPDESPKAIDSFLEWPTSNNIPDEYKANWHSSDLLTYNIFSERMEHDIDSGKCYILSRNSGSGKPAPEEKIIYFLEKQHEEFNKAAPLNPPAEYGFVLEDFSRTVNGNYNFTTAKNILYLYDSWEDLKESIYDSFDRLNGRLDSINAGSAMVYVCNSLCPGRFLGDPFAGQITAYSLIFSRLNKDRRLLLAYYPHQSYTFFNRNNKGSRLLAEMADYALFAGGVLIKTSTGEII